MPSHSRSATPDPDGRAKALQAFRDLIYKLTREESVHTRDIVCTPTGGYYEYIAYWVITVNGSPPRITFLLPPWAIDVTCVMGDGHARRLREAQADIVLEFKRHYLHTEGSGLLSDAVAVTIPPSV